MNKIILYPNKILRKKSEEVGEVNEEIRILAGEMVEIMVKEDGIGLAAPQVGILKRIIVVMMEKGPETFVNPRIIVKSKETEIMEEGCLCLPGVFLKIKRAKKVEVEALNLQGEKVRMKTEGLTARIFQHEIDHLEGILFIDRASLWQKIKLKIWT